MPYLTDEQELKNLERLAVKCTCGHSGFNHIHLSSDGAGIPQGTPTYCGYPGELGSCPCEKFTPAIIHPDGVTELLEVTA